MKKILLITYYWPPSGGAGVQRPLKFAKYFSLSGNEVFVLTVNPGKASYPVTDETLAAEIPEGVKVFHADSFEPLWLLGLFMPKNKIPYGGFANTKESASQKVLRFIRGNFFIPDARVGWVSHAYRKAVKIIEKNKIENVLISSPPHSSQLIGLKLKKKFPSIHWIADLRDPWTDIYYYKELMHTSPARSIDKSYERKVLEKCDAALVVSPSIKKTFAGKSELINPDKITVIPNGYDEDDFPESKKGRTGTDFVITYVGTMADSYNPGVFFDVMKEVIRWNDVKIKLRIAGSLSAGIQNLISASGLSEVTEILFYIPHDRAIEEMKNASLLLLIIPDVPGANGILTGKLFEYLGSMTKILGIGPTEGDAAAILNHTQAGKVFSRDDRNGIKSFLEKLIADQKTGKDISVPLTTQHEYSRRKQTEKLDAIFHKLHAG